MSINNMVIIELSIGLALAVALSMSLLQKQLHSGNMPLDSNDLLLSFTVVGMLIPGLFQQFGMNTLLLHLIPAVFVFMGLGVIFHEWKKGGVAISWMLIVAGIFLTSVSMREILLPKASILMLLVGIPGLFLLSSGINKLSKQ